MDFYDVAEVRQTMDRAPKILLGHLIVKVNYSRIQFHLGNQVLQQAGAWGGGFGGQAGSKMCSLATVGAAIQVRA